MNSPTNLKPFVCAQCGEIAAQATGAVNRALKLGRPLHCNRTCAGLARRKNKTPEQKKEEKRLYDAEYRAKNREKILRRKAAYHKRTYDPVKAAVERKKRMPAHIKYCQQPAYKAWKKQYDRQYRAKKFYGEFWECFLLTQDIRAEALTRQSDYEIRLNKGTLSKAKKRKREHEKTYSTKSETIPVGNLERNQERQNGRGTRGFSSHARA